MTTRLRRAWRRWAVHRPDESNERGMAMIMLLVTVIIVTLISMSLIGFMKTDLTHASIHHALARSFYIAQAGLEEAKLQVFAAPDPLTYSTPGEGVTEAYGNGRFTYRVAHESETVCGAGLTTLESMGQAAYLNRTFSTRLRACGVAGAPFLAALFGVGRIQLQGAATRLYLAPYRTGTPGGGGNLGSFTEINFSDNSVRVNAFNDVIGETVTLRDGRFLDYMLFGFPEALRYDRTLMGDPVPWILGAFGDIIKAQPATGLAPNPCGTRYACVTVGNNLTDITRIADLRGASYAHQVYMNRIREATWPRVFLAPAIFRTRAAQNTANAAMNTLLGFPRRDAVYSPLQFYQIVAYLAANPSKSLVGSVFVEGSFLFSKSATLGDITLAVGGDLVIGKNVSVVIRHDLSTASGRRTPGVVVFEPRAQAGASTEACDGDRASGLGRFVLCEGSALTVDGLVYTQDGMAIHSRASVDQVGAMYHDNRGTANPSFFAQDATVVLRFDPVALSVFGQGVAILSWQQLQGREGPAAAVAPAASTAPPSIPPTAPPTAGPEPPAAVDPHVTSEPATAPPATVAVPAASVPPLAAPAIAPRPPVHGPQRPDRSSSFTPTRDAPSATTPAAGRPAPPRAVPSGLTAFHVQAGAFRNRLYAEDLAARLRAHGYTVSLVEGPLIRVWVGPPMSQGAAERFAARLRLDGFEALLSPAR